MKGTWAELYTKGHAKIRWTGWSGYIVIRRDKKTGWRYSNHDGDGIRQEAGHQDYLSYANQRMWESVEEE